MRLAWFSPVPPVRSGISAASADLVPALRDTHEIDVYVDEPVARLNPGTRSAHDFVWRHRQTPYDLAIYQLGNSSHHDYIWPYLFRYPGLAVLHDAHVHHARAATLLRTRRADHYRAEFAANHPGTNPDLAEIGVKGFDTHLYYWWPMTRLVATASRVTAVHAPVVARQLQDEIADATIEPMRLAHGTLLSSARADDARTRVRQVLGIRPDAILFGVFGGLSPEKRVPQVLAAFAALLPYAPAAHLLLAGASPAHYDAAADVRARGLSDYVTLSGYLQTDDELTDAIAATDVSLNLRWPTAREMSGPWLRALAAGKPTIIIDLAHLADVPSLDPRTWTMNKSAATADRRPSSAERRAPSADRRPSSAERGAPNAKRQPPNAERQAPSAERRPSSAERRAPSAERQAPSAERRAPIAIAIDILDEDHSLRVAMRRLAADGALRAELGAAARAYWEANHSPACMLDDYERLIALAYRTPARRVELPPHLVNDGDRTLRGVLERFAVPLEL